MGADTDLMPLRDVLTPIELLSAVCLIMITVDEENNADTSGSVQVQADNSCWCVGLHRVWT